MNYNPNYPFRFSAIYLQGYSPVTHEFSAIYKDYFTPFIRISSGFHLLGISLGVRLTLQIVYAAKLRMSGRFFQRKSWEFGRLRGCIPTESGCPTGLVIEKTA